MSGHGALLNDLPCPAFQAVVDRLPGRDVASLRLVSTTSSSKATHATRSIVLRLSGAPTPSTADPDSSSSSTHQQLRSWRQATCCFDHVPAVTVHVSGRLSTQWSAALRALSLRGNVKALHILPAPGPPNNSHNSSSLAHSTAAIPSLVPVRQLLPDLASLTVGAGLTVTNLSEDVDHFLAVPASPTPPAATASAGPGGQGFRRLQHLNLSCTWSASGSVRHPAAFTAAMAQLPHTFPDLTHLRLQLPGLLAPSHPYLAPTAAQVAAAGGTAAATAAAAAARAAAAATTAVQHTHMQASMLAATVAAAAALPQLQHLNLARVPDIWAGPAPGPASNLPATAAAAAAAAVGAAVPAAAFRTLDDLGSWLLLQLPLLAHLRIDTVGATCCMAWDRAAACPASSSSSSSSVVVPSPTLKLTYHAGMCPTTPAAAAAAAAARGTAPAVTTVTSTTTSSSSSSSNSSSTAAALLPGLAALASKYTRRPASEVLSNVTALQAAIRPEQLAATAAALAAMPALNSLKLTVLATSSQPTDFTKLVTAAAAAAAAPGGRLQSLTLLPGLGKVEVAPMALLPLVPAAGGSSLKELRLVGNFGSSGSSSSSGSSGSGGTGSPWALPREMQGLEVLRVHQIGSEVLDLPVSCLPAGLRVLDTKRVHLLAPAVEAGCSVFSDTNNSSSSSSSGKGWGNELEALVLQDCRVGAGSLCGLSSNSLQQLCIAATDLPGGWPAAVSAWPRVRHLTLWCPAVKAGSNARRTAAAAGGAGGGHGAGAGKRAAASATAAAGGETGVGAAAPAPAVTLLHGLSGFKCLEGLELQHLDHLSPAGLHVVLAHMPHLSHLAVSAARVSPDLSVAAAAAAGAPGTDASCSSFCDEAGSSSSNSGGGMRVCSFGCCDVGGCCVGSTPSLRYVAIRLPAVGPRAAAAAATTTAAGAGAVDLSGGNSGTVSPGAPASSAAGSCSVSPALQVQHSMLSMLPWCGVTVAADVCSALVGHMLC